MHGGWGWLWGWEKPLDRKTERSFFKKKKLSNYIEKYVNFEAPSQTGVAPTGSLT